MNILAIESSCDETAAAVVSDGRRVLSSAVLSQTELHAEFGGVVPEVASRRHAECISPLTQRALDEAGLTLAEIDAVAATAAPGLIGALLVGLNFAKSLAFAAGKPFIPVHHIRAHIAAAYIAFEELEPPFTALAVSGGHTSILDVRGYTEFETLGVTRDDAAGECFDKAARVLGLGYPGGPEIDRLAASGNAGAYKLPSPKIDGRPLDFSFSGLKTHVINTVHRAGQRGEGVNVPDMCASFSRAVCEALVSRVIRAADVTGRDTIILAGGVAANRKLREAFKAAAGNRRLFAPPTELCGDNAAMVGAQAFFEYNAGLRGALSHNARASMPANEGF